MPTVVQLSEQLCKAIENNAPATTIKSLIEQGADPFLTVVVDNAKTSAILRVIRQNNISYFKYLLASKKITPSSFGEAIPKENMQINFLQAIAIFGSLDMLKLAYKAMGNNTDLFKEIINEDIFFSGASSTFAEILMSGPSLSYLCYLSIAVIDDSLEANSAEAADFLDRWSKGLPLGTKDEKYLKNGIHIKWDGRLHIVQYLMGLNALDVDIMAGAGATLKVWLYGMTEGFLKDEKLYHSRFIALLHENSMGLPITKPQPMRFAQRGDRKIPLVEAKVKNSKGVEIKFILSVDLKSNKRIVDEALAAKALEKQKAEALEMAKAQNTQVVVHQRTQSTDETLQQLAAKVDETSARVDRHSDDLSDLYSIMDKRALDYIRGERRGSGGSQGSGKSSLSTSAKSSPQHSAHDPLVDARVQFYTEIRKYLREHLNDAIDYHGRSKVFTGKIWWNVLFTAASIGTYAIPEPTGIARLAILAPVKLAIDRAKKGEIDAQAENVICTLTGGEHGDKGIDAVEKLAILAAWMLTASLANDIHATANNQKQLIALIKATQNNISAAISSMADGKKVGNPLEILTREVKSAMHARTAMPSAPDRRASKGGPGCVIS